MLRRSVVVLLVALAGLTVGVGAGGWAVVTIDDLPETITAGKATPISFVVRQHGVAPMPGLRPWLQAVSGSQEVTANAHPAGGAGQYAASLTLPRPADWTVTIHTSFNQIALTLLPVTAVAAGTAAAPLSAAERGHRLFLAKGCVTCHQSDVKSSNPSLNVGPPLVAGKYQADFLAKILRDPASVLPGARDVKMPDLGLQAHEVTALVAFINAPAVAARR